MFKKMLLIACGLSVGMASAAMAEEKGAGCGAGKLIFKGQTGLFPHLLAATTNSIYSHNTFAMSSGTSGCDTSSTVQVEREQNEFLASNFRQVLSDMARGQGDFVVAYANVLGCSAAHAPAVASKLQASYNDVVQSDATPKSVLKQTKTLLHRDKDLNAACSAI